MLTNGLKISDITKKDLFQVKFSKSDLKRSSNYCRTDFSSFWDPLTSWQSWGVLKRESLDI